MYEDYWQLRARPFEPVTDGVGFYAGETYQGAMLKLQYALQQRRPLAVLSGPAGVGKTLLIERLLATAAAQPAATAGPVEAPDPYRRGGGPAVGPVARVVFPQMGHRDLLAYVADRLGEAGAGVGAPAVEESVRRLERVFAANQQAGRHAVLVIDEAQLLEDSGLLETVRLLLNLGPAATPAATVLLVGQLGLLSALARRPALDQRVAVKAMLQPLSHGETAEYVRVRLAAAGAESALFSPAALKALHELAGGVPRRIDRLGDLSLVVGYADGLAMIDAEHVESVSRELVSVAAA